MISLQEKTSFSMKFGFKNDCPTVLEWLYPSDDLMIGFSSSGKLGVFNIHKQKLKRTIKRKPQERKGGLVKCHPIV